jgi:hypothetical protein
MQFIGDLLGEDGGMHMNDFKLSSKPIAEHETREGLAKSLNFSQSWHEYQY